MSPSALADRVPLAEPIEAEWKALAESVGGASARLKQAFELAELAHRGQARASGEPYILHPLAVARLVAGLVRDEDSLIAALLHDVVEDTETSLEDLSNAFGESVAALVDGVTKIQRSARLNQAQAHIETLRKMILASASDLRVLFIKLADRLHNMRTLKSLPEAKRRRISQETLDIYAPLAQRLGMESFQKEMEDHALQQLEPEAYQEIKRQVDEKRSAREVAVDEIIQELSQAASDAGIQGLKVLGRPKHFYSIWLKMQAGKSFSEIYDLVGVRLIAEHVDTCYTLLAMIHDRWAVRDSLFKDYVANPKPNGYRSLHTTVHHPSGRLVEVQIRTREMDLFARCGVAAHWAYKANMKVDHQLLATVNYLRGMALWVQSAEASTFTDDLNLNLDVFTDRIFVQTPKGRVVELPAGATVLDFAFRIHTDLALRANGALVNGRFRPLRHGLQSGDTIEIQTSKTVTPNEGWLKLVTSRRSKAKILAALRQRQKPELVERARQDLKAALAEVGVSLRRFLQDGWHRQWVHDPGIQSEEDFLFWLALSKLSYPQILEKVRRAYRPTSTPRAPTKRPLRQAAAPFVDGMEGVPMRVASCCRDQKPEAMVAYVTQGSGLSLHYADCPNLEHVYDTAEGAARIHPVQWREVSDAPAK